MSTRQGTSTSSPKMVRLKEKAKRKTHIPLEIPPYITNKHGVHIRSLPAVHEKAGGLKPLKASSVASVITKKRQLKHDQVSPLALTMTDLVGYGQEIYVDILSRLSSASQAFLWQRANEQMIAHQMAVHFPQRPSLGHSYFDFLRTSISLGGQVATP